MITPDWLLRRYAKRPGWRAWEWRWFLSFRSYSVISTVVERSLDFGDYSLIPMLCGTGFAAGLVLLA